MSLYKLKSKFIPFYQPQKCVDEFNYLGIIINKHLKWNSHVNKIGNKISQTIGVINKLKHLIPQTKLLSIYNSPILPPINYCVLAWGHDSKRIFKLQKKPIQIIAQGSVNAHSDPIVKTLEVIDIHLHQQLKLSFKLINNILPDHFYEFNLAKTSQRLTFQSSSYCCFGHFFSPKAKRKKLLTEQLLLFLFELQDFLIPSSTGILNALQRQTAVAAYISSQQLLLFVQPCCSLYSTLIPCSSVTEVTCR